MVRVSMTFLNENFNTMCIGRLGYASWHIITAGSDFDHRPRFILWSAQHSRHHFIRLTETSGRQQSHCAGHIRISNMETCVLYIPLHLRGRYDRRCSEWRASFHPGGHRQLSSSCVSAHPCTNFYSADRRSCFRYTQQVSVTNYVLYC